MVARLLCLVVASPLLLFAAAPDTPAPKPVKVFVTSAGAVDGMTDPSKDNQDTVRDLKGSLKGKQSIELTDKHDEARIVLIVHDREKAQMQPGLFGPGRDCVVRVTFSYNGHESEMSGSAQGGTMTSGGAWSKAAGKVAKQVEEWVKANAAKLEDAPAAH